MGSTFLPAKRSIQYSMAAGIPDPNPNGYSNKRSKPQPAPLHVLPGHVAFRLLSHASRIGGVIGKSGNIIKQLQQQTGAKIRIEDAPIESPDRVITVIGQSAIVSKVSVLSDDGGNVEFDVSKAQEALVRVFERILEVAAETDGINLAGGVVSCRLLVEANQVGSIIGKGGKVVEKIRKDYGVKIKVLIDQLPLCAGPTEEMVEIEGTVLAVKKALVVVSRCLQDCQPVDKARMYGSRPPEAISKERLPEMYVGALPHHNSAVSLMPTSSFGYPSGPHSLSIESDRVPSLDTKSLQQEVGFRILCTNERIGGVIGQGGTVIKALQNETGASVTIGAAVDDCDERLITVTASENPESQYSAAQKAVVLVFLRSVEAGVEKGLDLGIKGSPVSARLVVPSNQVGCLMGKGGTIVSEMRKTTGTSIRILGSVQVPKCVLENDQVVQISGDFMNVKDAIYHITGRLRDNFFSSTLSTPGTKITSVITENSPYGRFREPLRDTLRDPFRDALRDPVRDTLGDTFRDPSRDAFRDPSRDAFRDPSRDAFRDPSREAFRDPSRDPFRDPSRDTFRDPSRDAFRDPSRDAFRDPSRDAFRDPSRDAFRDPSRDAFRDPSRDAFRDPSRDASRDPFPSRNGLKEPLRVPVPLNLHSSVGSPHSLNRNTTLAQGMDHLGLSYGLDLPPSPRSWASQTIPGGNPRNTADSSRGLASYKGGLELGSGRKSAIVTNTTVEIVVPENVISLVYGENGNNLARLRQISGAKVIVHEPRLGTTDRTVVISGTPDETQAAQSLLQAFILTGQT
ncbi:KH domain-containing protein HEN4 [Euphorbia lathyris]|uniref:KH domain-containing protein HEN4 n=1 Tax=Euphorbia lathyris TaxID=212925 RepID=UPI00331338CB